MRLKKSFSISQFSNWWASLVIRFSWWIIILTLLLSGLSLYYTAENLGVNTDSSSMLSQDLPFQKNRTRIEKEFPKDAGTLIFVVEADTPEQTSQAAIELEKGLLSRPDLFEMAYIPTENDFFRQQAFLFLEPDELESLLEKMSEAQPFLGFLAQNYHLPGLLELILKALNQKDTEFFYQLNPVITAMDQTFADLINQTPSKLSWQNLFAVDQAKMDSNRLIVIGKPIKDFTQVLPAEKPLTFARELGREISKSIRGSRIRITGETALEHEELESVSEGSVFAGVISFILVCASLWIGLRSVKLLIATLIVLILGLILTAGFATLTIGHLNTISIAFAVLYIGLGVDYAIHICLHYRECRANNMENQQAIMDSVSHVGFSLFLCALTTSIGFLAFVPTDFSGVSELGIISSGGMVIGLLISLLVLPSFLTVFSLKEVKQIHSHFSIASFSAFPAKYAFAIKGLALLSALLSVLFMMNLVFDSNPINMRDPQSESVSTIKELLKSKNESPFALTALADNAEEAEKLVKLLEDVPTVHDVIYLNYLVANDQDEKLETLEELDLILANQLVPETRLDASVNPKMSLVEFNSNLSLRLEKDLPEDLRQVLEQLHERINQFLLKYSQNDAAFFELQANMLDLLPITLQRLKQGLTAEEYTVSDIPAYIRSHWLSDAGQYKILITPEHDQNQLENMKQFITEVQQYVPGATGLPVADQASGVAVVDAFIQAFVSAMIAIMLILLVILKSGKHTLLVMWPLLLAGLMTCALNVLLDNAFNFANIIALPLLMGMGVDSSIHIMQRLKSGLSDSHQVLQSSTARAVFFSSLTTLFSFSSLAFTPHQGTASMGLLLAIGIFFTLFCTLIVLPAFYTQSHKTI